MIEMTVSGIILEPQTRSPILVLKDLEELRALLIWIGPVEANSILLTLEKVKLNRPLTHDLMINIFKELGIILDFVLINDVNESTFFAQLHLKYNNEKFIIDARPSDAVALALRADASIFVTEDVMLSNAIPINHKQEDEETLKFKEFIQNLKPSDFNLFKKDNNDILSDSTLA